jgi:hypothetical protein
MIGACFPHTKNDNATETYANLRGARGLRAVRWQVDAVEARVRDRQRVHGLAPVE